MKLERLLTPEPGVIANAYHDANICGAGDSETETHLNYYYQTHGHANFLKMIKRCIRARLRAFDQAFEARMAFLKRIINSTRSINLRATNMTIIKGKKYVLPSILVEKIERNAYVNDLEHIQFVYLLRRLYLLVKFGVRPHESCTFRMESTPTDKNTISKFLTMVKQRMNKQIKHNQLSKHIRWQWKMHYALTDYFTRRWVTIDTSSGKKLTTRFNVYRKGRDDVVAVIPKHKCEETYVKPEDVYIGPVGVLSSETIRNLDDDTKQAQALYLSTFMSLRFGLFYEDTWKQMVESKQFSAPWAMPKILANECFNYESPTAAIQSYPPESIEPESKQIRSRTCNYIMIKMLQDLMFGLRRVLRFVQKAHEKVVWYKKGQHKRRLFAPKPIFQHPPFPDVTMSINTGDPRAPVFGGGILYEYFVGLSGIRRQNAITTTKPPHVPIDESGVPFKRHAVNELYGGAGATLACRPNPDGSFTCNPPFYTRDFITAATEMVVFDSLLVIHEDTKYTLRGRPYDRSGQPFRVEYQDAFIKLLQGDASELIRVADELDQCGTDLFVLYANRVANIITQILGVQQKTVEILDTLADEFKTRVDVYNQIEVDHFASHLLQNRRVFQRIFTALLRENIEINI